MTMITICAYRATIGSFYGSMREIKNKNKSDLITSVNCFLETYENYIALHLLKMFNIICISEQSNQNLKSIGDPHVSRLSKSNSKYDLTNLAYISRATDNEQLLLSGDIEEHPGPGNLVYYEPSKLENNNNVCFANATLQLLSTIPEFVNSG